MIVQVGSALAYRAIPLQSAYCGAKHGVRGFTDSLRSELLHDKINVHLTMVQLPAVNTPQFVWCESKMPRNPQPVPPIYKPEMIARAIVWAAHHRRRELYVAASTAATLLVSRLFPGQVDRFLASTGYESQQTGQPTSPDRPSNLFQPVPGGFRRRRTIWRTCASAQFPPLAVHARAIPCPGRCPWRHVGHPGGHSESRGQAIIQPHPSIHSCLTPFQGMY